MHLSMQLPNISKRCTDKSTKTPGELGQYVLLLAELYTRLTKV